MRVIIQESWSVAQVCFNSPWQLVVINFHKYSSFFALYIEVCANYASLCLYHGSSN
jgi:hypothetical protein